MTEAVLTDPRDAPIRGAPLTAFGRFLTKFAVFAGRASRSEYWWVVAIQSGIFVAAIGMWSALLPLDNGSSNIVLFGGSSTPRS